MADNWGCSRSYVYNNRLISDCFSLYFLGNWLTFLAVDSFLSRTYVRGYSVDKTWILFKEAMCYQDKERDLLPYHILYINTTWYPFSCCFHVLIVLPLVSWWSGGCRVWRWEYEIMSVRPRGCLQSIWSTPLSLEASWDSSVISPGEWSRLSVVPRGVGCHWPCAFL